MARSRSTERGRSGIAHASAEATSALPSPAEIRRMIAEAAYYRAATRGFRGGDPVQDWLAAEAEIKQRFFPNSQKSEQAAYERLRTEVQKGLAAVRDSVDAKTVQNAIERASGRVKKAGKYAGEAVNKASERLKREIADAAVAMGPRWETFSDKTVNVFAVWRSRGGAFLGRAAIGVGDWIEQTGRRLDRSPRRGDGGAETETFECVQCGEVIQVEAAEQPRSCPKCGSGVWRGRARGRQA